MVMYLAGVLLLAWFAVAIYREVALFRAGGTRSRENDWTLFGVTLLLLPLWFAAFGTLPPKAPLKVATASVLPQGGSRQGGCGSVPYGLRSTEVKRRLGEPDSIAPEEDVRGPGAVRWTYAGARCQVHLVDGMVDFVE